MAPKSISAFQTSDFTKSVSDLPTRTSDLANRISVSVGPNKLYHVVIVNLPLQRFASMPYIVEAFHIAQACEDFGINEGALFPFRAFGTKRSA